MMPKTTEHVPFSYGSVAKLAGTLGVGQQMLWVDPVSGAFKLREGAFEFGPHDEEIEELEEETEA